MFEIVRNLIRRMLCQCFCVRRTKLKEEGKIRKEDDFVVMADMVNTLIVNKIQVCFLTRLPIPWYFSTRNNFSVE